MYDRLEDMVDVLQGIILKEAEETCRPEVIEQWDNSRNRGQWRSRMGFRKYRAHVVIPWR